MNYSQKVINNRVLVIDDEEDVVDFLRIFLSSLGWTIAVARSAAQAFAALDAGPFFLVLTDIAMPDMDGYEFVNAFRDRAATSEIAMMTGFGYNPKHTLIKINKTMKCAFFFKPFDRFKVAEGVQQSWNAYHHSIFLSHQRD
jgi:DNA-binding NtrC family response regulator